MNNIANVFQNLQTNMGNNINTCMIGKIIKYNVTNNTSVIELMHYYPSIQQPYTPLLEVPIGYFNIGGYSIKVTPKIGDIVIILFFDYDIDNLLVDGKTKTAKTQRVHALEDAIAIPLSINFLNNSFNATEDLTISKNGGTAYIKLTQNDEIELNFSKLKLGRNANKKVLIENGNSYTTSSKVYAE